MGVCGRFLKLFFIVSLSDHPSLSLPVLRSLYVYTHAHAKGYFIFIFYLILFEANYEE